MMQRGFRTFVGLVLATLSLIGYQNCAQEDSLGKALHSATAQFASLCPPRKSKAQMLAALDPSLMDALGADKVQIDPVWLKQVTGGLSSDVTGSATTKSPADSSGSVITKPTDATGSSADPATGGTADTAAGGSASQTTSTPKILDVHKLEVVTLPAGAELVVTVDLRCAFHTPGPLSRRLTLDLSHEPAGLVPRQTLSYTLREPTLLSDLQQEASEDSCVKLISQQGLARLAMVPTDPSYNNQPHHKAVQAEEAWDIFFDSQKGIKQQVVVAIVDSGVKTTHEDLKEKLWVNAGEVANNRMDEDDGGAFIDDYNGYNFRDNIGSPDPFGSLSENETHHGTHVAGLVAAHMNNALGGTGIMAQTGRIMALNVYGDQTALPINQRGARFSDIDNAIYYAIRKGAHIINLSLGAETPAPSTRSAIEWAVNQGLVVVMAAGNGGQDKVGDNFADVLTFPASYSRDIQGAISVGSVDASTKARSSFSNYGNSYVEIAAPGSDSPTGQGLFSTTANGYGQLMGTSMASPVVAGAAGLAYGYLWTKRGMKPHPSEVEAYLTGTADKLSILRDYFIGGSYLNLFTLSQAVRDASSTCP